MEHKFNAEDVRLLLLGKLPAENEKALREELKWDPVLKDIYSELSRKKETLEEYDSFRMNNDDDDIALERILNAQKNDIREKMDIIKGQIWKSENLSLHFLVLSEPTLFNEIENVRIIPVTHKIHFQTEPDVLFSEKILSFKPSIAHITLHSIIKSDALDSYICTVSEEIVHEIEKKSTDFLSNYSLNASSPVPLEESFLPEFVVWYKELSGIMKQCKNDVMEANTESLDKPRIIYLNINDDSEESSVSDVDTEYKAASFGQNQLIIGVNENSAKGRKSIKMFGNEHVELVASISENKITFLLWVLSENENATLDFSISFEDQKAWKESLQLLGDTKIEITPPVEYQKLFHYTSPFSATIEIGGYRESGTFCVR